MSIADKTTIMSSNNTAIAENVPKVYEAGQKSEYDRFWDAYQHNGNRTNYQSAFYRWVDECFYPKYDIKPSTGIATQLFAYCTVSNIKQRLIDCNVILDLSKATSTNSIFSGAYTEEVPEIDLSSSTNASYLFEACKCVTVDKLTLPESGNINLNNAFISANYLENIIIAGTIGVSVNLQWSTKLSAKSIASFVEALSSTTSGLTLTLSQTAVNNADWTTTDYADWNTLIATKPNWTFNLL